MTTTVEIIDPTGREWFAGLEPRDTVEPMAPDDPIFADPPAGFRDWIRREKYRQALWAKFPDDSHEHRQARYAEYMASPEWQTTRLATLERDGHQCQHCGRAGNEAHHLRYDRLGNERPTDLTTLCEDCHGRAHPNREPG